MDKFQTSLMESGLLHRPLIVDDCHSYEQRQLAKEIIENSQPLMTKNTTTWQHEGRGSLEVSTDTVKLSGSTRYCEWPDGAPADGDYVTFGSIIARLPIERQDWSEYTQLKCQIRPECTNVVNPNVVITLENEGEIKIPDIYDREGTHVINLKNNQWQTCVLDISNLPRDVITGLRIATDANGSYMNLKGSISYTIKDLRLEKNKNNTAAKGWQPKEQAIIYAHNGYHPAFEKTALIRQEQESAEFLLKEATTHKTIIRKAVEPLATSIGAFGLLDFSEVNDTGTYYLQVGTIQTEPFKIDTMYKLNYESIWKSLNFIFCERCGCPVHGIHGTCHEDIVTEYKGTTVTFNGGWQDAGDLSQQLVQTAEVTASIFEMAAQVREQQPQLYLRLLEEGEWGIDFILKTRLDEGDRLTSAGITRWTDNRLGNMDDAVPRIHNSPYDNFLITGILAKIVLDLEKTHPLREKLLQVIKEDYGYAYEGFKKAPFTHDPVFWEHTYSTSKSTFLATLSWTAALLFQLTTEPSYKKQALDWFEALLACQESQGILLNNGTKLKGMFYRDETHKVFQHFNHQAREHIFAQAFEEMLRAFPTHEQVGLWQQRAEAYGEYLVFLKEFTAPYPMFASGIYRADEWQEQESFYRQHLLVDKEAEIAYQEQLLHGVKIGSDLYIKRFPVWFSFRGNNGVLLSMGISAAIIGRLTNNRSLLEMAHGQLHWLIGKNPFGQSMMYGEGYDYPQQYSVSSGEMMGELPVGMQTFGNEDEPYWPQFNNATYKEVWVGIAGKWLSLTAELSKYDSVKGE